MEIYFSKSAYRKLVAELERWYPKEASIYPLAHLVLNKRVNKSPLDTITLLDVERVVFVDVVCPPDEFKRNTAFSTKFNDGQQGEVMNKKFLEECVAPVIDKYPLLDLFTLGHSHPFAKKAWLSSGGRESDLGTLTEKLEVYQGKGFGFVFEILGYGRRHSKEWKLAVFAMTPGGLIKFEKPPEILRNNHPCVHEAKRKPYFRTYRGEKWIKINCKRLREAGFSVSRGYLSRGWDAYTINASKDLRIVVCIPPFFPHTPAKIYQMIIIGESINFLELELPEGPWKTCNKLSLLNLIEIAEHCKKGAL